MIEALTSLTMLGVVLGGSLGLAARLLRVDSNPLAKEIAGLLPGGNCGQCGYPGCEPAAEALADGTAPITLCPLGGRALVGELAEKLGANIDLSSVEDTVPKIAFIFEDVCIGCTKCLKRCPTDAIVGASRQIHAVVDDACTGCERCIAVCPTEAVSMRAEVPDLQTWYWPKPTGALAF